MFRVPSIVLLLSFFSAIGPASAQTPAATPRPTPPTRDPNTAGYVTAKELPDRAVPPVNADGNFIIGPTHEPAPEMTVQESVRLTALFTTSP